MSPCATERSCISPAMRRAAHVKPLVLPENAARKTSLATRSTCSLSATRRLDRRSRQPEEVLGHRPQGGPVLAGAHNHGAQPSVFERKRTVSCERGECVILVVDEHREGLLVR